MRTLCTGARVLDVARDGAGGSQGSAVHMAYASHHPYASYHCVWAPPELADMQEGRRDELLDQLLDELSPTYAHRASSPVRAQDETSSAALLASVAGPDSEQESGRLLEEERETEQEVHEAKGGEGTGGQRRQQGTGEREHAPSGENAGKKRRQKGKDRGRRE